MSFASLPLELVCHVMSFMDDKTLCRFSGVNRLTREAFLSDFVLKQVLQRRGITAETNLYQTFLQSNQMSLLTRYKQAHKIEKCMNVMGEAELLL